LLKKPPEWSDTYYARNAKRRALCQLVDAPYFADSKNVGLLQVADFLAYFVRRHVEIKENAVPEKYKDEAKKMEKWFSQIKDRTIPYQSMYPKRQRRSEERRVGKGCRCGREWYYRQIRVQNSLTGLV